ncbi:hypothetical protein BC351_01050 [Paenibacillus ferrarius]|uniref:Uncharacterized protein n=1 Tax=Paenibacillus ferrarius TaxID=1469647 RepID=A0A1V4HSG4_9BACL|nr:hypothetical protein [Paenibacillus ferrarius]OPH61860.1 hypothetical protein BC351_01050 [Paenibacillus ferrarius]
MKSIGDRYVHVNCYEAYNTDKDLRAQVKCFQCQNYGTKKNMTRLNNKNIHLSCVPEYEKKCIENEHWDRLYNHVKEIHSALVIPKGFITRLQKLRNGTYIKSGKLIKQYKCGFEYELILDAYLLGDGSIKWNLANKLIEPYSESSMHYCFEIMYGKISEASRRREQKHKQAEKQKRQEQQPILNDMSLESKSNIKYKKDESDITAFI